MPYAKAIVAALLASLGSAYLALNDNNITAQEWVQIAQVGIAAGAAVYGIPNVPNGKRVAS
jgi:hypothetical protein